ncbi:unnamed protein product, partial [Mesorhabditis belari]|uniref:Uncharacterized protein n=1 Tax=Mesorhabditis belari TaxID=2138241 RepID=A0AAF3EQ22_9BILA
MKADRQNEKQLRNCSDQKDGRTLSCYTCLGRDLENCEHGLSCCKGSCFKLVDKKHDVIIKGCTVANEEDASMKMRTLSVPLYWAKDEFVTGESYFCKSQDYCNGVSSTSPYFLLLMFALTKIVF